MRIFTIATLVLGIGLLVGCGGPPSVDGDLRLRTAPQWITEVDLPGCSGPGAPRDLAPRQNELWLHPLDDQLVVVTTAGTPTCITAKSLLIDTEADEDWSGQTSATVEDDPIPLVRERDTPVEGETDDDPIPLVRLANGLPEDDPIPLVRERDLEGAQSAQKASLPGDKK